MQKFGLLFLFTCHSVTPPCSRLQMTTSTQTGLNFDKWILMDKNALEARNLFTENWSLFSFYIFNFQVIPWLLFLLVSFLESGSNCRAMKLKSELLFDHGYTTCDLRLFAHSSPSPKKIQSSCRLFYWQTLNSPGAVDQFNFNILHWKISTLCTVWD